ncbi:MAG: cytochrome c [Verrucomicrobiaceae bacterium]|nr:cytochrome c [Verrucomicrobiaceae bacterium]
MRFLVASILVLGCCGLGAGLRAHPLQAEPINHPYVFTFDQFNLAEDPDDHLVNGGLLLMAELRCGSCHEAPSAWRNQLEPARGPDLAGVGSRLDADTLWLMIRGPQLRKRGTQMPALLYGNAEGSDEKVEALVSFLSSLKKNVESLPQGDSSRGRKLYHQTGCVACHEPASDVTPPGIAQGQDFDRPGNASVPIAMADAYDLQHLARFLLDPRLDRPSGRMPSQRLNEQEAADIAAYLHEGRKVETAPERKFLAVPPQSAEAGKKAFSTERCVNCHTLDGMMSTPALPMGKLVLDTATNCLTAVPEPGAAKYDFNPLQLRALRLALKRLQAGPPDEMEPTQRLDWQMTRLNCYACHDRDGKGGPEEPRAAYFSTKHPGSLPPSLDFIGGKLLPDVLKFSLVSGAPAVRPSLEVRMPLFSKHESESLLELFKLDQQDDVALVGGHAGRGSALAVAKCASCHILPGNPAPVASAVDLTSLTKRVTPWYFRSLMLGEIINPLHPPLSEEMTNLQPNEIADVWQFLSTTR